MNIEMTKRYCPVCEVEIDAYLPYGAVPRENAQCPNCLALPRIFHSGFRFVTRDVCKAARVLQKA